MKIGRRWVLLIGFGGPLWLAGDLPEPRFRGVFRRTTMLYLGIDLHRKQLIVSLRNEKGDVLLRRQVRQYMELVIEIDGTVRCLYDEAIDLARLGKLSIRRGSHVEPAPDGQWLVDLSPVGGPLLAPFARRSQALAAERQWLAQHWL